MHQTPNTEHVPVLLAPVLEYLAPKPGESYLDVTAGYGGHARQVLLATQAPGKAVLIDQDESAAKELKKHFGLLGVSIRHQNFLEASEELIREGREFDLILADLGVSSPHLNEASRGFAFSMSGPLDMRMDLRQARTAEEIVNHYSQKKLAEIILHYGEEPKAWRIAEQIVRGRPIKDTLQLADIVSKAARRHSYKHRIHAATKVFQAIRIEVNRELERLQLALPLWLRLLSPGGRIAIISFHSLEDRIVKETLANVSGDRYDAQFQLLTKRPIMASQQELVTNPRARSAKLRAAVKNKQ